LHKFHLHWCIERFLYKENGIMKCKICGKGFIK